ncbi:hypothetical protein NADFUDRAFT_53790 [Nadsonia fulvescens var. elongata DSM 6958]|uniref:PIN domain-containing protein n=1 Tax=Nadsonia fulvescens var. elongata DSM 6958 TaxID=857566 RepID=A0A1E3PCP6_9ASCO|nr:hypothetical protein NADFUDRAFT_53790 [Nadsonia fulvescens var. elongata DSM 6958]
MKETYFKLNKSRNYNRSVSYAEQCLDHQRIDLKLQSLVEQSKPSSKQSKRPRVNTKAKLTPQPTMETTHSNDPQPVQTLLVIDTNFVLSHLSLLEELRALSPIYGHTIVVPWMVTLELDGLKKSRETRVAYQARLANDWMFQQLTRCKAEPNMEIMWQDKNQVYDTDAKPELSGDDAILDCGMYCANKLAFYTILLSNDKNLCAKAMIHEIRTISFEEGMSALSIAQIANEEGFEKERKENDIEIEVENENENMNYYISTEDVDMDCDDEIQTVGLPHSIEQPVLTINYNQPAYIVFPFNQTITRVPIPTISSSLSLTAQFPSIYDFILNCVRCSIEYHLSQAYDAEDLGYIIQDILTQRQSKQLLVAPTFHLMAQILDRFQVSVFGDLLGRRRESLTLVKKDHQLTPPPDRMKSDVGRIVTKTYMNGFMALWGSVAVSLAEGAVENSGGELQKLHTVIADVAHLKEQ